MADQPESLNLLDASARLVPLESFDPAAFIPDAEVPEEVCGFVLALALALDDIRDNIYGYLLLKEHAPSGLFEERPDWGMYGGLRMHLIRQQMGLVHELCNLIRKNQETIAHPFMQRIIMQMPKTARESWQVLVDASTGKLASGPFASMIARMRNKISSHYDVREILKGYKRHFFENKKGKQTAYISRGKSMDESRLYFADAAAQAYMEILVGEEQEGLFGVVFEAIQAASHGIMLLVNGFIQGRGFAYKKSGTHTSLSG